MPFRQRLRQFTTLLFPARLRSAVLLSWRRSDRASQSPHQLANHPAVNPHRSQSSGNSKGQHPTEAASEAALASGPNVPAASTERPRAERPRAERRAIVRRQRRLQRLLHPFSRRAAMVLVAIHRDDLSLLARQSPQQLQRDLVRWSRSSIGLRSLRGAPLPSLAKIEDWIARARKTIAMDQGSAPPTA
jgi:hypothetical protein